MEDWRLVTCCWVLFQSIPSIVLLVQQLPGPRTCTRWNTARSSKAKLPHAIELSAIWGAHLVTLRSKFRPNETLALHRVDWLEHNGTKISRLNPQPSSPRVLRAARLRTGVTFVSKCAESESKVKSRQSGCGGGRPEQRSHPA